MEVVDQHATKIEALVKQLAEFIALYEVAADKVERHELLTGQRLANIEAQFNAHIESINASLGDYQTLLSETGIARWRLAAEQALKEGQAHLEQLQQASQAILNEISSGVERFDRVREAAVVQVTEASKLIGLDEFRQATQNYRDTLEVQTDTILERLQKSTNWFYWQRVIVIVLVGVLTSLTTAFVLTSQFPWETHRKVSLERKAGQALLKAWPHLSASDKNYLKQLAGSDARLL